MAIETRTKWKCMMHLKLWRFNDNLMVFDIYYDMIWMVMPDEKRTQFKFIASKNGDENQIIYMKCFFSFHNKFLFQFLHFK